MIKLSTLDVYKNAHHFWNTTMKEHQEATWDEFMTHFSEYMLKDAKYNFHEDQLKNLRNLLDPQMNMTITLREFVIFYQKHWSSIHGRRKIIKDSVPFPEVMNQQYFLYDLKLIADKCPRNSLITKGQVFTFPRLDIAGLVQESEFDTSFGKKGCTNQIIKDESVFLGKELFRITPYINGYKVKCNEKNKRLKFKVEEKPYTLLPGMVIQVGLNTLLKVTQVAPVPHEKNSDYFILFSYLKDKYQDYLVDQQVNTQEEYNQKFNDFIRKNGRDSECEKKKLLRLECIAGPEKGEIFDLEEKLTYKQLTYTFGRTKTENDYHLSDITVSANHFNISLSRDGGWIIHELKPSGMGTYILLPTHDQMKKGAPSYPHEVNHEMKLCVDEFTFCCNLKRTEDKLENIIVKMATKPSAESPKSPGTSKSTQARTFY